MIQSTSGPQRESIDSVLGKNLVVARMARGLTQQQLANLSRVSRATIAQLETGYSDPRLSTVAELAAALDVPLILLLIGADEVRALIAVMQKEEKDLMTVSPQKIAEMKHLLHSGLLKDRLRAARIGAAVVQATGREGAASVSAGIFSAFVPGPGTTLGALFGKLLTDHAGS